MAATKTTKPKQRLKPIDKNQPRSGIIIRVLMEAKDISMTKMAEMMGYKHPSSVHDALSRDMKYSVFVKMLDVMGYEIKIHPKYVPNMDEHLEKVKDLHDRKIRRIKPDVEPDANTEQETDAGSGDLG